jgi:hypothetical protein
MSESRESGFIKQAFFQVCSEAKPATGSYVSLYASVPFYGGPEEGGWWGQDIALIAHQGFGNDEKAAAALDAVTKMAAQLTADSKRAFGDRCLAEMKWLDERGLDADYLPEVDGETTYFAVKEDNCGSHVYRDSRCWDE